MLFSTATFQCDICQTNKSNAKTLEQQHNKIVQINAKQMNDKIMWCETTSSSKNAAHNSSQKQWRFQIKKQKNKMKKQKKYLFNRNMCNTFCTTVVYVHRKSILV